MLVNIKIHKHTDIHGAFGLGSHCGWCKKCNVLPLWGRCFVNKHHLTKNRSKRFSVWLNVGKRHVITTSFVDAKTTPKNTQNRTGVFPSPRLFWSLDTSKTPPPRMKRVTATTKVPVRKNWTSKLSQFRTFGLPSERFWVTWDQQTLAKTSWKHLTYLTMILTDLIYVQALFSILMLFPRFSCWKQTSVATPKFFKDLGIGQRVCGPLV